MPKSVEVPGVGTVEFPDNMSEKAMNLAVKGAIHQHANDQIDEINKNSRTYRLATGKSTQLGEMKNTLWEDVKGIPGGLASMVMHPEDTWEGIQQQGVDQRELAKKRFKEGRYSEAAGHGVAALLPVVGPFAAQIGDEFGEEGPTSGTAWAHVAEVAAPEVVKKLPLPARLKVRGKPIIPNVNNPVEERALQLVQKDVRMTPGQRQGSHALQRVERGLENLPGSSSKAQKFFAGQEEDIARKGRSLASQPSPVRTNEYGAGQGLQDRLADRFTKLKSQANNLYDQVRQTTSAAKQTVQTGTKPIMGANGPLLGPSGAPLTAPVMQVFEAPVDLAPLRGSLQPIYHDLMENMPEVRRVNSPAFRALDNLMKSDKTHMNAMDFDKFLGAVKAISRDGDSPFLTSQSQALARKLISTGENGLNRALNSAGPDVAKKLRSARNIVKSYYETGELRSDFGGEPASVYYNLARGGDRMVNSLKTLQRMAPHELQTVGRTYLEGMVDKATKEGGFGRAAGVLADWDKLGPTTKEMLFGKQLSGDIDNFLIAAKKLTKPVNPSGSAHMVAAFGTLGVMGKALMELFSGSYERAGETVAVTVGLPNVMSRVLFSPGGAKLLTQAISLPVKSPASSLARNALRVRLLQAARQSKSEQANNPNQ